MPNDKDPTAVVDPGEDGENEVVERMMPGFLEDRPANNETCMYEIARKRFNIDKEAEAAKLKQELELVQRGNSILDELV